MEIYKNENKIISNKYNSFNQNYKKSMLSKSEIPFMKPIYNEYFNDKLINANKENEYSLMSNFFDPTNHSPPNDFLLKLQSRINEYYKKESNLFNE